MPLDHALDVGCGSGQSTEILSPYFQRVTGIDSSKEQLQHAQNKNLHPNVLYRLGSAEDLGEPDNSIDLVTCGMAIHWFNLKRFSAEVGRVLRQRGTFAVYGYSLPHTTVNNIPLADTLHSMIKNSLGKYIPDESKLVYFEGYKGRQFSKFPFSKQSALRFEFPSINKNASINDLLGYISTMSGFQNYMIENGEADAHTLLDDFKTRLAKQAGGCTGAVEITFPYVLLLSRKHV